MTGTHADVERFLEEMALSLEAFALTFMNTGAQFEPMLWVVPGAKDAAPVVMPIPMHAMSHRLVILTAVCRKVQGVGFAFCYDGFISEACPNGCGPDSAGCPTCLPHPGRINRTDCIVTVIRTKWGYSVTRNIRYRRLPDGMIETLPDPYIGGETVDSYGAVWSGGIQ